MNFDKYLNLIILIFLLEIISNSSADEWKKLKRKLIALSILHGIRVKTIIPLPVPLPLPIVIRKFVDPIVLPPKRVPFLVPKPVPYYQVIPKFVPIYPKDTKSHPKHWSEEDYQLAQQTTQEDFLLPSDNSGINNDIFKLSASDLQPTELLPVPSFESNNKFNFHEFQDQIPINFIDPFERSRRKKMRKFNRKLRKQIFRPFDRLKAFNFKDNTEEELEDLMMLSTEPKTKPEETISAQPPNSDLITKHNIESNQRQSANRLSITSDMNKQILRDLKSNEDINKKEMRNKEEISIEKDLPGVKTTVKKIKVGELRFQPNQLKALLAHQRHSL